MKLDLNGKMEGVCCFSVLISLHTGSVPLLAVKIKFYFPTSAGHYSCFLIQSLSETDLFMF